MKRIKKTTAGLIDILFKEIEALNEGTSTPQSANAIVGLAKAIISTKRLEIDTARFVAGPRTGNGDKVEIPTVSFGS